MAESGLGFWQRLQQIPRYYVYLLLACVVSWQILFPIALPILPSRVTKGVYDAIAAVPDDQLILISTDWDASTEAETGPQTEAVIHACFQNGKRFAIMNLHPPMGVELANDIAERVAAEYGAEYGVDWSNWGYKYGFDNVLIALAKNIPKTIGNDFRGNPVTDLPMMAGVEDIESIGLVIEITGLANVTELWIGLIQGVYGTPLAGAYTAVMVPSYYPFLDSGQLRGVLNGAKGAAEMEVLVKRPDRASAIMPVQSWVHMLIIALIIIGNLGYIFGRRRATERPS